MPPSGRPWLRLDATYRDDPRVLGLDDPLAELLYLRGLAWCKAQNTDGHIPRVVVARRLAGDLAPREVVPGYGPYHLADELVSAGLWVAVDDGWQVPAERWAKWQTTAAELDERRDKDRERKAQWRAGKRSPASRDDVSRGDRASRDAASAYQSREREEIEDDCRRPHVRGRVTRPREATDDDDTNRIRSVALQLAGRDYARRTAEVAIPVARRSQWLDAATNRRITEDGTLIRTMLGEGLTVESVVAKLFALEEDSRSPAAAARALQNGRAE